MGACPVSDALPHTVSNGLMLVGDAAHHTDPITGRGIMALQSGTIAGQVANKAVRKNDASVKVLLEYETEWNRSFGESRKRTYRVKEFVVNLSDDEISRIFHAFAGITAEELNLKGTLKRLLRLDPRLLFSRRKLL
jgi:digeranylgeranylglycerophospholipid reductase